LRLELGHSLSASVRATSQNLRLDHAGCESHAIGPGARGTAPGAGSQCADYPSSGDISFFNQLGSTDQFLPISPAWTVNPWYTGLTPQCNYGGSFPTQLNLTY
jgi:hypothetical protein